MNQLHLFGATTSAGESFRLQALSGLSDTSIFTYSRQPGSTVHPSTFVDFNLPDIFHAAGDDHASSVWISFGPIWSFASFFERLAIHYPERLCGLRGLIACSSSSVLTKRYAFNTFDRDLSARLDRAEYQLLSACERSHIACRILRPSLIYGKVGRYQDRNLNLLVQLLRRTPLLPVPSNSGFRQPIHASQLAAVALQLAKQLVSSGWDSDLTERISLGGDSILTYEAMVRSLQQAQASNDPARRCVLLPIPNRLFFLLAAPLLLRSPKTFEAVLRMGSNLSGFTPAHVLLGCKPQHFPLLPLG